MRQKKIKQLMCVLFVFWAKHACAALNNLVRCNSTCYMGHMYTHAQSESAQNIP